MSETRLDRPPGLVFVSYSHADLARVRAIVDCLVVAELNVWWDHETEPGERWRCVIEDKLREASCVIVVWSKSAVESVFVAAEVATVLDRQKLEHAADRGILVPVKIDAVRRLPLPFGEYQFENLADWDGSSCGALRPLITAARKLSRRTRADGWGQLSDDWSVRQARDATRQLRGIARNIGSLRHILMSEAAPAAAMRATLVQVHKTYDAVNDAITEFVASIPSESGSVDRRVFAKYERGALRKQIRDGRGHCDLIAFHYGRAGGLREWLSDRATDAQLRKADETFGTLSMADGDLFAALGQIGEVLTNESRAIVNLGLTGQDAVAIARLLRGREALARLEGDLDTAMTELQELEQQLGYVPDVR
jgi:hypothetical protein